jgi:hypothetical protein
VATNPRGGDRLGSAALSWREAAAGCEAEEKPQVLVRKSRTGDLSYKREARASALTAKSKGGGRAFFFAGLCMEPAPGYKSARRERK